MGLGPEVVVAGALELDDGQIAAGTAADKAADDCVLRVARHAVGKLPNLILRPQCHALSDFMQAAGSTGES